MNDNDPVLTFHANFCIKNTESTVDRIKTITLIKTSIPILL